MQIITFKNTGEDYSGFVAACLWLRNRDYSYGTLQGKNPIGIIKGKFLIQKWTEIGPKGRGKLDGTIEFPYGSPRLNPAIVRLK